MPSSHCFFFAFPKRKKKKKEKKKKKKKITSHPLFQMFLIAVFLVVAAAGLNKQSMNVRRLDQSANPAHPMSHFECSACISFINEVSRKWGKKIVSLFEGKTSF
jgi:hypothetical protein